MIDVLFVRASAGARPGTDRVARPFRVAQSLLDDAVASYVESSEEMSAESLSVPLDPYYPQGPLLGRPRDAAGRVTGPTVINVPVLREVSQAAGAFLRARRWAKKASGQHQVVLLMTNYLPVATALRLFGKWVGIPRVVTLTDLAGFSFSADRIAAAPLWKRLLMRAYARHVRDLERSYDGYVLLTEQMNDLVNPRGNPSAVVEGVLNLQGLELDAPADRDAAGQDVRVIAHAGTLDRLYGVGFLLDAFGDIRREDVELWLFGTGDMDEEIQFRSTGDDRIKFYGFQPRPEVFKRLQQADLLVNLRDPKEEYTKYSFPSKLLEYMASGTPVATTSLSGIPDEYADHLYVIQAGDVSEVSAELVSILERDVLELEHKGVEARNFMLANKTAAAQCPRIADLLRVVVGKSSKGPS